MAKPKVSSLSLEELYERIEDEGKATPSVVKAVNDLEDFSKYTTNYVNLICRTPKTVWPPIAMKTEQKDIMVIQNHPPFPDKWKRGPDQDYMHARQMDYMMPSSADYHVVNLVKFFPRTFPHPSSRKIMNKFTQTQMKGWLQYLLHEIEVTEPKVIIATSTEIVKLLGLADKSNTNNRGEIHISPLCDIPVVITLHPKVLNMIRQTASGGMWGDDYLSVIAGDFQKAHSLCTGDLVLRDLEDAVEDAKATQITVCTSLRQVQDATDFLMKLPAGSITSWDLETNSLDAWYRDAKTGDRARILTSQVGYRKQSGEVHAIVIPLWHRDNDYYDPDEAFEIHKEYLLRDSAKVGHNITFDICFLAATTGVRLNGTIFDTLLALHSIDSGIKGCYGLKVAVWDHLTDSGLGGYEDLLELPALPES